MVDAKQRRLTPADDGTNKATIYTGSKLFAAVTGGSNLVAAEQSW